MMGYYLSPRGPRVQWQHLPEQRRRRAVRRALLALFLQGEPSARGRPPQGGLAARVAEVWYPTSQATVSRDLVYLEGLGRSPTELLEWAREQLRSCAG